MFSISVCVLREFNRYLWVSTEKIQTRSYEYFQSNPKTRIQPVQCSAVSTFDTFIHEFRTYERNPINTARTVSSIDRFIHHLLSTSCMMANRRSMRHIQARGSPETLCISNHDVAGQKKIQILKRQCTRSSETNCDIPGIPKFQKHFKTPIIAAPKEYSLNKEKAVDKKIKDALKVQPMTWHFTGGGTMVYCQTGMYSKLVPATLTYFDMLYSMDYIPRLTICKDMDGNVVQYIIKVAKQFVPKSGFTINMYNTSSSLLINGSQAGCKDSLTMICTVF